jgi:hypothetical protein
MSDMTSSVHSHAHTGDGLFLAGGPEDFAAATLRQVWLLLEGKRGARAMLSRQDIDPMELRHVLPRVGLIDVHHDPLRFRMRLAGTNWREGLGFDPTGLWLDEWPHERQGKLLTRSFGIVVAEKRAMRSRRHTVIDDVMLHYEAMIIPLASDGHTINMLMTVSAPLQQGHAKPSWPGV